MSADEVDRLEALREDYARGRIGRDEFWQRMRDRHCALRDYSGLLCGGDVAEIAMTADGLTVRLASGLRFRWNPENLREPVSVAVNHGFYEAAAERILERCAREAALIVDAGANIGWYAVRLSAAAGRAARVVAFEPVPDTAAALEANIALNGFGDRVRIVRAGLSDAPGDATIYLPEATGHVGASLQDLHPDEASRTVRIPLTTLDREFGGDAAGRIGLIKCDVEGAELLVLRGGQAVIARDRPILFLELLRKWSARFDYRPDDVIAWAARLGYDCFAVGEGGLRRCTAVDDATVETNYLFLQPDRDRRLAEELA